MDEWYYTTNNQQMGPVSGDELRQLASSGLLKPSDLVWKQGMADWQRAEKQAGLFAAKSRLADVLDAVSTRRARRAADDLEPAPRHDEDDDRPRRRDDDEPRRRRRAPEGLPLGAKVAIIGGSIVLGLLVLIVVIILVVRSGAGSNAPHNFTIVLGPNQEHTRTVRFTAGQAVRITVRSTVNHPQTDVDLLVDRANGAIIAGDEGFEKDCDVNFIAPATENYRLRVRNLGPGRATCVVNFH